MDLLERKRAVAESLAARMDEILPPYVFDRPEFAVVKVAPVVPITAALINDIEPVLEGVENQLNAISSSRMTLKSIERELALIRSKR
jgi:hypothetical protein